MTKEARLIATKEESEARSIIAQLGLCRELKGTHIMQELITGKRSVKVLTDLEIEQIVDSWQTRHYVPIALIEPNESIQVKVDNVKLYKENGETEKEYKRRKVELIAKYLKTIHS